MMETLPDVPLARSMLRVAAARRLDLARLTLAERKSWPVRVAECHDDGPEPRHVSAALAWIGQGQARWGCGGIPAAYSARTRRYSGPYPETTGYSIPTLLRAAGTRQWPEGEDMALRAADWLASRQLPNGAIRCNIELPETTPRAPEEIVLFDCGAILQGFSAMARRTERFAEPAARLAGFLVSAQRDDGTWNRHLAFRHFGSHNALVAYALIEAGDALEMPALAQAGHKTLAALRARLRPDGYIEGCEFPFVRPGIAFLHPFVYTIEGYLKAEALSPGHGYLEAVLPALDALRDGMAETGELPGAFVSEGMTTACAFTAPTALAQLADVGFRADRLIGAPRYDAMARSLMAFLRGLLSKTLTEPGWAGALPSAYPIDGEYLPFCVNNWGTKYFVDATLEEIDARAGRIGAHAVTAAAQSPVRPREAP